MSKIEKIRAFSIENLWNPDKIVLISFWDIVLSGTGKYLFARNHHVSWQNWKLAPRNGGGGLTKNLASSAFLSKEFNFLIFKIKWQKAFRLFYEQTVKSLMFINN